MTLGFPDDDPNVSSGPALGTNRRERSRGLLFLIVIVVIGLAFLPWRAYG